MRKVLVSLVLLLLSCVPIQSQNLKKVEESVGYLYNMDSGHCSAFAVAPRTWLTADHCIQEMGKDGLLLAYPQHLYVQVDKEDAKADLALVVEQTSNAPVALVLKVAADEPALGDGVEILGWPSSYPGDLRPLVFFGHVQAEAVNGNVADYQHPLNLFHEGGGPGMSGGPIVNQVGEVVGMAEGAAMYPSVSVASPTVKVIRKFLGLK